MNLEVLSQFLSEDADAHARRLLLDTIREGLESDNRGRKEFSFNRFIVILDFSTRQVEIEDDLTTGPEGEYKLEMSEFGRALR